MKIGARPVGEGQKCFIIAEAGVNHNGELGIAKKMVDVAKAAGADAVKFQMFKAGSLVVKGAAKADYQKRTTGTGSQYDMLRKLELSEAEFRKLAAYSEAKGILFLSSPFDEKSIDLLVEMDVPAIKIASGEITNHPLLAFAASKKRPIILSTGMATMSEIGEALKLFEEMGNRKIILLHCVTSYPAKMEQMNLRVINTMRKHFSVPVGLSDHTPGIHAALAAVALGASMVEKHFTLDKTLPGPDHKASLDPDELEEMVRAIRCVEIGLGDGLKNITAEEKKIKMVVRRSIVSSKRIPKGAIIDVGMLAFKRPGTGISPKALSKVLGRKTKREIPKDTILKIGDLI